MGGTQASGASAPATRAAVAAGACALDLKREAASRRVVSMDRERRRGRGRGRNAACYTTPPYFPSDVC
jgi:hypothetical protein